MASLADLMLHKSLLDIYLARSVPVKEQAGGGRKEEQKLC